MTMSINMSHMEGSVSPIVGCSRFNAGRYGVKKSFIAATASSLYENDSGTYKFTEKDLDVRAFTFKISYSSTDEVI